MAEIVTCSRCGDECKPSSPGDLLSGYGSDREGRKFCYDCCAALDVERMIADGRATLYLVNRDGKWAVVNFPGSLDFPTHGVHKGRHNIGGSRRDAWFDGPDGYVWHVVSYGDWTEIGHCRRTRKKTRATDALANVALDAVRERMRLAC